MVCSRHDCSARKVECTCHLLHLCAAHALGFKAHGTAIQVNLSTFREDVNLVEGVEYVKSLGKHAVFLPQHHVVAFELVQCCLCKGVASGQCVGNDAKPERTESFRFGNHAPQQSCKDILAKKLPVVAHGYYFYGVGVYGGLVGRLLFNQAVVHCKVAGQLGCGLYGMVGNDNIAGTIV